MKLTTLSAFVNSFRRPPAAARRTASKQMACALLMLASLAVACRFNFGTQDKGIPPEAQAVIDAFSKDVNEGRYEKIYTEASEEWKSRTTTEQTKEVFTTIKEKLGTVKTRTVQTIRNQENSGVDVPGHSIVVIYQTAFERAEGMETFTLVERDGRWMLAGYFVNSSALK